MSKRGSTSSIKKTPKLSPATLKWGAVLLAAVLLFLFLFKPILTPFVISAVIAFALHPFLDRLERWGLSRTLATALILLFVLLVFGGILLATGPRLLREAQQFFALLPRAVTTFGTMARDYVQALIPEQLLTHLELGQKLQENFGKILSLASDLLMQAISGTIAAASFISTLLLMPILLFYFLRDWPKILTFVSSLMPLEIKETVTSLMQDILAVIKHYFRGVLSVSFVLICYYSIALSFVGMKFSLVLGILSGLLVIIPYVGFFVAFVTALAIYYPSTQSLLDLWPVVTIYAIGQVAESFVLTPKLVGDKVGLHPLWVIFALLGGGFLFGFIGVLLAVPIAACLAVVVRFVMTNYREGLKISDGPS